MSELRYLVKGRIAEDHPTLNIKAGTVVWLTYTREAGGWYEWSHRPFDDDVFGGAFPFTSKEKALSASKSNGPWFNVPDPASIEIVEVNYTPAQKAKMELISV